MLMDLFAPRGIAVIGASRDRTKLGYGVARNLVSSNYPGAIHFINPKAERILGQRCYPSIGAAPDPIDLAVVIVPAPLVPQTIEACGQRGICWAIIVSGGFRETDRAGAELEDQIVTIAHRHGMRLIGPNCIGLIDTHVPFNTTFIKSVPNPGEIAFVSQSGAICQAVIDWGTGMGFGFSRIASLGNQADLSEAEVITALSSDPHTRVITMYLEGVKDGAQFKQAVSEAAREKSIVALKVGRSNAGKRAVSSHTGALASSDLAVETLWRLLHEDELAAAFLLGEEMPDAGQVNAPIGLLQPHRNVADGVRIQQAPVRGQHIQRLDGGVRCVDDVFDRVDLRQGGERWRASVARRLEDELFKPDGDGVARSVGEFVRRSFEVEPFDLVPGFAGQDGRGLVMAVPAGVLGREAGHDDVRPEDADHPDDVGQDVVPALGDQDRDAVEQSVDRARPSRRARQCP